MGFSIAPEMSSKRRIALVALLLTLAESALMLARDWAGVRRGLGDTDDAMRLVLVRELLHGRGWYDQLVTRLDPPHGTYMHWSRLLDGALAAAMWLAGRVLSPADAEFAVRIVWPLLWVFPATFAALVIARNLGARTAVLIAAALMAVELQLYRQFRPGRVDHHQVQITLALASLAIATTRELKPRAAAAGVVTALGLAIGLEALPFQALAGASIALRLALDRTQTRAAGAYGLALAAAGAGFYALETPPWRWGLFYCDAIGANLVLTLVLAGLGLAGIAALSERLSDARRWGLLGLVGVAAAASWLALDPACVHGPFGGVDARERIFWLDRIQELRSWPLTFARDRPMAIHAMVTMVMGLSAALFLWWRSRLGSPQILALAALAAACVAAFSAERMEDYSFWIGLPILAAGFSFAAQRWLGDRMAPTVAVFTPLTPIFVGALLSLHLDIGPPKPEGETTVFGTRCMDTAAFERLSRLPRGVVLADIDLGAHVLANTPHDAVIAPYHRMSATILAVHDAVEAPPDRLEAAVRRLGATYVVDCPAWGPEGSRLMKSLRTASPPPWLTRLSPPGEALQIWRVAPG